MPNFLFEVTIKPVIAVNTAAEILTDALSHTALMRSLNLRSWYFHLMIEVILFARAKKLLVLYSF